MRHLRTSILLLFLASNAAMAQEVSEDEARSRALQFLSTQSDGPRRAKDLNVSTDLSLAYTSRSEAKTCFYVFNVGDGDGFVIAGGDQAARPILGYSDHGTFDYDKAPDNFKWWLSQYTEQIALAEAPSEDVAAASAARRAKAASARVNIGPLIQTKWDQDYPYNSEIPIYDASKDRYVTGCVATAMAQVLYFHRYPETNGLESHTYTNNGYSFTADFANTTYDWNNMLLSYDGSYSDEQAKAVGTLMYHAGVSVNMDYGVDASGAYSENIGAALVRYFGYDKSVRNEYRDYYTDEEWEDLVYSELAASRPVLYSGASRNAGHQFICDGYDNEKEMFCFNWGWGGFCDGVYTLTGNDALKPNGSGIGGAGTGSAYTSGQSILTNVQKNAGGEPSNQFAIYGGSFFGNCLYIEVDSEKYDAYYEYDRTLTGSKECCLFAHVQNISCLTNNENYTSYLWTRFDFGLEIIEQATGIKRYLTGETGIALETDHMTYVYLDFNPYDFEYNGIYELHPVFCLSGTESWERVKIPISETIPAVIVTGAENREPAEVNFRINDTKVMVSRTLQITHDGNYTGSITYTSSDNSIATVNEQGLVTGAGVGSVTITAKGEAQGTYLATEKSFELQVNEFKKKYVDFSISSRKVDTDDYVQISWAEDYDGELTFTSSNPEIATVDDEGKVTGISEGKVKISATATETDEFYAAERTFSVEVTYLMITLVEEPYFNNDNNAYMNDLVLHFKARNDCNVAHDVIVSGSLSYDGGGGSSYQTFSYVNSGGIVSGQLNFAHLLDFYMDFHDHQFPTNKQYTVNLYMNNGQPFEDYPSVTFTYRDKLTVDYGVSPAGYGTLILPFNAELPEGMTVYTCPEVDDNGVLTLEEDTSIRRNVPYIVKATYGESYQFVGPEAIDADKPSFQNGILVGAVTKDVPLQKGTDYILQVQGDKTAFYRYMGTKSDNDDENDSSGNRLAAQFRAFLRLEGAQNAKLFLPGMMDEETEGIATLRADGSTPAGIYTIDGHRYDELQKGLNILILGDGTAQKVFVK